MAKFKYGNLYEKITTKTLTGTITSRSAVFPITLGDDGSGPAISGNGIYFYEGSAYTWFSKVVYATGGFNDNGNAGIDGSFTNTIDGYTVTVSGGIITNIA